MTFFCVYCSSKLDPNDPTTYRRCRGWERKGLPGSRRGGSDIVLREAGEEFACWSCIDRKKRGLAPSQGALL